MTAFIMTGSSLGSRAAATSELVFGKMHSVVSATEQSGLRTYTLESNAPLRENLPEDGRVTFSESPDHACLRTGNLMFDGLYAMAVHEALQNSVDEIRDYAYGNGTPLKIDAFQTGEKWHYVWTRDLSYAVNLGLASFDPQRCASSLLFKTSARKPSVSGGVEQQIIQDTGSGGSYPVSTDRVVWALGAWETLKFLDGAERDRFLNTIYPILLGTIEQDRMLAYDADEGLYNGEQSFLDWREQTYPGWTRDNVLPIALSKSLSVNVLNYYLLITAAECAGHLQKPADAELYSVWADSLKSMINAAFYDPSTSQYSAYLLSDGLCDIRTRRIDLLGESLAIIAGVADADQAVDIIAGYPIGPHGPSVVWPQERSVPIYHNQGIWPFVTAYWIKAARMADNAEAVSHGVLTMQRLAALNLSNMENYDFVSGRAEVKGQALNGPVINSRRQLWSVAGYLSMVQDVLFGMQTTWDGIRFQPYVTDALRRELFVGTDVIELRNLMYRGTRSTVRIQLPASGEGAAGAYAIQSVMLNGHSVDSGYIPSSGLKQENEWIIQLVPGESPGVAKSIRRVDPTDEPLLFGPAQPQWGGDGVTVESGRPVLRFTHPDASNMGFNIYRDGVVAAWQVRELVWRDVDAADCATVEHSYSVAAVDPKTGNESHLTPFRYNPLKEQQVIPATEMKNRGGQLVNQHHFEDWGALQHELRPRPISVDQDGRYVICAEFSNGSGALNTGITCAIKAVELLDAESGTVVDSGYFVMPQSGDWSRWDHSSPLVFDLKAGTKYRLRIFENEYARNMSYLENNERYTAHAGGGDSGYNFVNIAAIHIRLRAAEER
ncbi:MAG: hypothetical protein JXR25_16550 [Pontiellaceae bacterium]|nr:hypothetical protein [Pontiellaceae bacterium]MBN2786432.1 hypothetical protein [Pontiellaceae bacterium]